MAVTKEITVNAPVEQVFNYVADISKHSDWGKADHKLEVKKTSDGPIGQGTTFQSVGHQFGKNEDSVTITEYVPNQKVVYEAAGNAGVIRHTFEVAAADGGTRLAKSFEAAQAKFPFALFLPIAQAFIVPGGLQGDLDRIKAKLEGGGAG
jgi:uncharacterized protein YndB with AHSA1/START domain